MSEIEEGETLCETWLHKLNSSDGHRTLRLGSAWQRRYFVLRRYGETAYLQYYRNKPHGNEMPRESIALQPNYKVEKRYDIRGKPFVCILTTPNAKTTLACDDEKIFHLLVFFIQSQIKLKEQVENECFMIRPDSSEDNRKIGARGNMCVLHVSPCGLILALELSKCVLAMWPLKSIKSYESSGRGQITIDTGRSSPAGEGAFTFKTRVGQDDMIYNAIDNFVNEQVEKRRASLAGPSEYEELQAFTYAHADSRFSNQLRRISRDIFDHLWQHIGGDQTPVRKVSSPDLVNDTSLPRRQNMNRSGSVPTILESSMPASFDMNTWSGRQPRSSPSATSFHNGMPPLHVSSPQEIVPTMRRAPRDSDYLDMSNTSNMSSPTSSPLKSPVSVSPLPSTYEQMDGDYPQLEHPHSPGYQEPTSYHPLAREQYINMDPTQHRIIEHPSLRKKQEPPDFRAPGSSQTLPSQKYRRRPLSRSCEDVKEHAKKQSPVDGFTYNNDTFNLSDEVFGQDGASEAYSYARLPAVDARFSESPSLKRVPKHFLAMRRNKNNSAVDRSMQDYRSMIRRSLSNPNLTSPHDDPESSPSTQRSKAHLPVDFNFLTRPISQENMNKNIRISNQSEMSIKHVSQGSDPRTSDVDSRWSAMSTTSSNTPLVVDKSQPPMLRPLRNIEVADGIRITGRTRTFKKQKTPSTVDCNQNSSNV